MNVNEALLNKEKCYIVGVSGGCDSMYLLDCLRQKGYNVLVAHVNYNYRYDSYVDFQLVRDYCRRYAIPFYYREFHDHDYCQGNFQNQARIMRYQFYKKLYEVYDCDGLILGHQLDDDIESIYMQLEHHNTVYYLGIKETNIVDGMKIIRPLMKYLKKDIVHLCLENNIPYHDDYTNFETDFERDRVRNTILNTYSKEEKEALFQKAKMHNERMKKLEVKVQPYYQEYILKQRINYQDIPSELMDIFLYLILKDKLSAQLISYSLICEIKKQMYSSKPNVQMNLPVNYLFIKEYNNIYIVENNGYEDYCYEFNEIKEFQCEYFRMSYEGHNNQGVYLKESDFPITIRNMRIGDKMNTSAGTKKVSRLFINAKIPMFCRKRWPLLLNKNGTIILIPNIAKNIDYLTTKPNLFVLE